MDTFSAGLRENASSVWVCRQVALNSSGARYPSISHGKFPQFPDLSLVDEGKEQLNVAVSVLRELEIDEIEMIGLAKKHQE